MKQDRTESFESPLDEVLFGMPQEDPPDDLLQRCLDALGGSTAQKPSHPNWWVPLRNVIAVAAGLLLVVGAINVMGPLQMSEEVPEMADEAMAPPPTDSAASEPTAEMMAPPLGEPDGDMAMRDESAAEPAGEPGTDGWAVTGMEQDDGDFEAAEAEEPLAPRGDAADIVAGRGVSPSEQPHAPDVEDPWRDFSGERQVVTTKQLDLEVGDVEQAYDDARSIVEKQGGFIATDRVQISEDQPDTAHLTIRIPVDNFEAAIAQIRQLGEVTRLVGESVDVTEQYYEEGADIREKADREQWLMDRLENATAERERQQLKHQIAQLRREMEQEKAILGRLAEQTHWPVLELTLTEASSPGEFLSRTLGGSVKALAWVGATAIIWVPLVVLLTLFWRRLSPRPPGE